MLYLLVFDLEPREELLRPLFVGLVVVAKLLLLEEGVVLVVVLAPNAAPPGEPLGDLLESLVIHGPPQKLGG